MNLKQTIDNLTAQILEQQSPDGSWNTVQPGDKYFDYPELHHYCPKYNSTFWTMIFLADIGCDPDIPQLKAPMKILSNHFFSEEHGIYSIGKSHFPIPCLNGNMLYLHFYFNQYDAAQNSRIIDFFDKYQRFDDGDYKTPGMYPYFSNKSCYGSHTCYWGVIKLLKGLSFLPDNMRSKQSKTLIRKAVDFVLLHQVIFRSHNESKMIKGKLDKITFPNMYNTDMLEVLWILKRLKVRSDKLNKAIKLLKNKMKEDGSFELENKINKLAIPLGKKAGANEFVTQRAKEVLGFYS